MRAGRVVEIGKPQDLYLNPRQIFTANFLGEANFLEGRVAVIEGNTIILKLRDEELIEARISGKRGREAGTRTLIEAPQGIKKETKRGFVSDMLVVAAIRPEFVYIARTGGARVRGSANTLQGRVAEVVFSGGSTRCGLALENGDHVACRVSAEKYTESLRIGEEVSVTLDPNAILVYPYPRIGLEKEISLE
jgi:ABC-type Fe3+/spermidine/putrescine transport system ATPase subunit